MRSFASLVLFGVLLGCGGTADLVAPDLGQPIVGEFDLAKPDPDDVCEQDLTLCKGECTDLDEDEENCGKCGTSCSNRPHAKSKGLCKSGVCEITCAAGWADCNDNPKDGCEADLSSAQSCHACGVVCQGVTPICGGSACKDGCDWTAPTLCGSSCRDTTIDTVHCGACDNVCPIPSHGAATCASSKCVVTCEDGYVACAAGCCVSWSTTELPAFGGGFPTDAQF